MSDAADIFGHPVADPEKARESFLAAGIGSRWIGTTGLPYEVSVTQHDCDFKNGHCQLGKGHPLPHCVPDPDGSGSYLMVDEDGWILREL